MTGFGSMLRKELLEQLRTFRLPVVLALFFMIGAGSPLLARYTPELMQSLGSDELGGFEILLTKEPTASDGVFQFQKNFALLPLLVVLLSMAAVGGEKRRGTAAFVLTKPVGRSAFLLSKFVAPALLYLVGTAIGGAACLGYTWLLLGPLDLAGYALVCGLLLLGLWVYLAITLLGSVLFRGAAAAAGLGLGAFGLFSALGALGRLGHHSPGGLGVAVVDLVLGRDPVALWPALFASAAVLVLALGAAIALLRRQEL